VVLANNRVRSCSSPTWRSRNRRIARHAQPYASAQRFLAHARIAHARIAHARIAHAWIARAWIDQTRAIMPCARRTMANAVSTPRRCAAGATPQT